MTSETWESYLDPGERLLWSGVPAQGVRVTRKGLGSSFASLFILAFALLWTAGAGLGIISGAWRQAEGAMFWFMVLFPVFGLPFIALGLYGVFGHYFDDARQRARTRYALTDRRALIAIDGRERVLRSWPIRPETIVDFLPGPEASLRFATDVQVDSEGDKSYTRVGFERIAEGEKVMRLIRQMQTGAA